MEKYQGGVLPLGLPLAARGMPDKLGVAAAKHFPLAGRQAEMHSGMGMGAVPGCATLSSGDAKEEGKPVMEG